MGTLKCEDESIFVRWREEGVNTWGIDGKIGNGGQWRGRTGLAAAAPGAIGEAGLGMERRRVRGQARESLHGAGSGEEGLCKSFSIYFLILADCDR